MLLQATDHTVDSFGIIYIGGFRDLKGETKSVYLIGEDQFADLFDKDFRFFKMLWRNIQGNAEICRKLAGKFLKPLEGFFINIIVQADDKTILFKKWDIHSRGPEYFSIAEPADQYFRTGDLSVGRRYFGLEIDLKFFIFQGQMKGMENFCLHFFLSVDFL